MSSTEPLDVEVVDGPPQRNDDGYYVLPDGTHLMSVTNIINHGVPQGWMEHWVGLEVARLALDSIPQLSRLRGPAARQEFCQWLRYAATRKRDEAADFGTSIHNLVEAEIIGEPAPDPTAEQQPYIDAFHRFCDYHQPNFEAAELVVANLQERHAGKGDFWAHLPIVGDGLSLGDWKTGKKVYDDAALQSSAYRRSPIGWLRDGREVTPPATERGLIVHLRPDKYPDTGYRVYTADTSDEVYASFLAARDVAYGWTRRRKKRALVMVREKRQTVEPIPEREDDI